MSAHLIYLHSTWYKNPNDETLSALLAAVRTAAVSAYASEFADQAQDMAQETTLRVWKNLYAFVPFTVDAFPRWLKVILKNERQHHFDDKRVPSNDGIVETPAEENHHADTSFLPANLQPAADLILAGYSIKEAAETLGLKECTLRKRFTAYRQKNST